jgi:signal peptidase I
VAHLSVARPMVDNSEAARDKPQTMKLPPIILSSLILISAACTTVIPVQPVKVHGTAMLPALSDGDRIVIERNPQKLERGDIIVFLYPDDQTKSYIKRIVGLPHEVIEVNEGQVLVNGKPLDEPYVDSKFNLSHRSSQPLRLPADNYYVLGDNRDNSSDSRLWGPVKKELIYGKYLKKYFDAAP